MALFRFLSVTISSLEFLMYVHKLFTPEKSRDSESFQIRS